MKKITVCVAESSCLIRDLVLGRLCAHSRLRQPVLWVETSKELVKVLRTTDIDVVLLGLPMEGAEGTLTLMGNRYTHLKVVVVALDASHCTRYAKTLRNVHGCISREASANDLLQAIVQAYDCDFYRTPTVMLPTMTGQIQNTRLTQREEEILMLICEERTMREISSILFISEKTVENHRANMMRKLGVHNTVGLMKYAFRNGLFPAN